ncbi:MAG: ABC transporter permease [Firmicutes bacterium]|jgi:putative ABC transport system permease protein|nr:ABC transporter permease [Bacillota bacterium]MDD4336765.1 ABC transporter permease [Bacillota bacterium]MDD4793054.1 ABC transporter permease [Bacillota bacterium]
MSLFQLAYSNVRENRRSYVSFFASFAFSVMVFYIFDAIATAPEIAAGGYKGAMALDGSLHVARWVIAVFSFFFTLYSNSAFLKMRKRDLGIMALLGATPCQVRSMLLLENAIIGLTSIVAGLSVGALLSRLIAMATLQMLRLDIPAPAGLAVNLHSIWRTALIYAGLFSAISLLNTVSVRTSQVIQLVRAPKKPKSPPATSPILFVLGVACLAGGYYVAYTLTPWQVVHAMFPVTAVVCVGTYLFFTQVSVVVLRHLSDRKSLYYRNINLITLSDLTFQMKDNARVLAAVTILSAIVLTSSGVVYSMGEIGLREVQSHFVRSVSFALAGPDDAREVVDSYVRALEAGGVRLEDGIARIPYLNAEVEKIDNGDPERKTAFLISEDDYNEWAERAGTSPIQIEPGCAVELMPVASGDQAGKMEAVPNNAIRIQRGGHETELTYCGHMRTDLRAASSMNYWYRTWTSLIAIDSGDIQDIAGLGSDGGDGVIFSCDVENWKVAERAEQAARTLLPEDRLADYTSIISTYAEENTHYGVTMFVAVFMMFLFFLASSSMLYFRFFLQLREDREKYTALRRLGLSWREIRAIVSREMAVLFFMPWVVATLHQTFALRSFATAIDTSVWSYGAVAAVAFLIPQTAYFLAARGAYLAELAPVAK